MSSAKKHYYYSNLVSWSSDNPKRFWQTVYKLLHRKSSLPLPSPAQGSHLLTTLLLSSPIKCQNFICPLLATLPCHLHTYLHLLQRPLFSPLSPLPLNLTSIRFFQTARTSNLILIPSPPGFSKNVHLSLSPQSLILSICHSLLMSSTPFSNNLLFLHSWKKSTLDKDQLSVTTVQSLTFLSYPK